MTNSHKFVTHTLTYVHAHTYTHTHILTLVEGSVVGQGFPTGVGEFLVAMEISGSLAALKGAECR